MNNLRKLCAVMVLLLALSFTVLAEGQTNCPGITQETVAGDIQNGVTDEMQSGVQSTDTDTITQTTFTLILVMLSVV